jgi:glycosyltransferase involved in cell wall biosynthesis
MVSPTYHDPWANSLNEACLHGLPVITTPAEGAEGTLAIDGYNAVVVPPGDVSRIGEAMAFFLDHKDRLIAMGKNSRSLSSKFNIAWAAGHFVEAADIAVGRRRI